VPSLIKLNHLNGLFCSYQPLSTTSPPYSADHVNQFACRYVKRFLNEVLTGAYEEAP